MSYDQKVQIPVVPPVREIDTPLAFAWATVLGPSTEGHDAYELETDDGKRLVLDSNEFHVT